MQAHDDERAPHDGEREAEQLRPAPSGGDRAAAPTTRL